jgi:hypothetical protein
MLPFIGKPPEKIQPDLIVAQDHCYFAVSPAAKCSPQPPKPGMTKVNVQAFDNNDCSSDDDNDDSSEDFSWLGKKSRLTSFGVESDFIPDIMKHNNDSDLEVYLKQRVVQLERLNKELIRDNQRAHVVLKSVFSQNQLKLLGLDLDYT